MLPRRELQIALLVGPGNEGREAAGLVLELAEHFEVQEAIVPGLLHAEHHRAGRGDAQAMGRAVNGQPLLGPALQPGDPLADVIDQDLRPPPGSEPMPAAISRDRLSSIERLRNLADVQDFVGRQGVQIDGRVLPLQPAEQVFVILDAKFRVEPALEQDLDAAGRHGLVDLGGQFLFAERIAAGPAGGAVKAQKRQ